MAIKAYKMIDGKMIDGKMVEINSTVEQITNLACHYVNRLDHEKEMVDCFEAGRRSGLKEKNEDYRLAKESIANTNKIKTKKAIDVMQESVNTLKDFLL